MRDERYNVRRPVEYPFDVVAEAWLEDILIRSASEVEESMVL
jgi:hypothetical protein